MWAVKVTENKDRKWNCDNHKVACLRGLKMESETNVLYMIRKNKETGLENVTRTDWKDSLIYTA